MILILGSNGMLGSEIVKYFRTKNVDIITSDIKGDCDYKIDITNYYDIYNVSKDNNVSLIINCVAWTNVDDAEDLENKEQVDQLNIVGVKNIVKVCEELGCILMHFSTDYVFDGSGDIPWKENDDRKYPLNYYGKTKLESERIIERLEKYFVLRLQWLYGKNGKNFVATMINLSKKFKEVRVVDDQIGTPTYAVDVAKAVYEIINTDKYGYYHLANEGGYISWYEFCKYIYEMIGANTEVIPVSSNDYKTKAIRPMNSRLCLDKYKKSGFSKMPIWQDALKSFLSEIV